MHKKKVATKALDSTDGTSFQTLSDSKTNWWRAEFAGLKKVTKV
jgi:hypothetical protein